MKRNLAWRTCSASKAGDGTYSLSTATPVFLQVFMVRITTTSGADRGSRREGRRLGGGQSFGEVLSHETDTLDVRWRVEAKTACRARGANEAVAALPRPQQLGADAGALAQLADPKGSVAGHPKIIQQLDSFLTELRPTATVRT